MPSPRIEYAVLPAGDGPGQDRCFTADGLVVVLDGASAIDPMANPDATDYVDTLGPFLVEQVTATPEIDLRNALAEAIRQTTEKLALVPGTAPSSTVSIVRWRDETIDVLVLGDSPVTLHFTSGDQETIVQHPQKHIAPDLRRRYQDLLRAGHGYSEDHRTILAEIQRQESAVRNQPDGYFIAAADAGAAAYAKVKSFRNAEINCALIATDGAANPMAHLSLKPACSTPVDSEELLHLLHRIHRWEESEDPNGRVLPRSKCHDDKAIALLIPNS